jgi:hypothetical protein
MKKPSRYKIIPTEKKSIIVSRTYKTGDPSAHHEGDKFITVEETYRWGYAVIEAYKKDIPTNEEVVVTGFELVDHAYEDGVSVYWEYPDDMSDEEKENIENIFDEDGDDGLEKLGWFYFDNEDKILPPFKIEKT